MKKLIIFDLDGTLAQSKQPVDEEMALLLSVLLGVVNVAIISGGDWPQFGRQLLPALTPEAPLEKLSLLPTCGTKFFAYDSAWAQLYAEDFSDDQKAEIVRSLERAVGDAAFQIEKTWGPQIEDRGSQITFSALGQLAPVEEKRKWDPEFVKRGKIKALLETRLGDVSVHFGGTTSLDITKPGIDKSYGIGRLSDMLAVSTEEMLYVGDALLPGGNDYPVKKEGVECIQVRDPEDSKRVIEAIFACLRPGRMRPGRVRPGRVP